MCATASTLAPVDSREGGVSKTINKCSSALALSPHPHLFAMDPNEITTIVARVLDLLRAKTELDRLELAPLRDQIQRKYGDLICLPASDGEGGHFEKLCLALAYDKSIVATDLNLSPVELGNALLTRSRADFVLYAVLSVVREKLNRGEVVTAAGEPVAWEQLVVVKFNHPLGKVQGLPSLVSTAVGKNQLCYSENGLSFKAGGLHGGGHTFSVQAWLEVKREEGSSLVIDPTFAQLCRPWPAGALRSSMEFKVPFFVGEVHPLICDHIQRSIDHARRTTGEEVVVHFDESLKCDVTALGFLEDRAPMFVSTGSAFVMDRELRSVLATVRRELMGENGMLCDGCGVTVVRTLVCGGCMRVRYCEKECQREDWKVHREMCALAKGVGETEKGVKAKAVLLVKQKKDT